ncbi:MAG: TRAP transporter small permease [Candidatus Accumulibacter sp.]|jgi:TRAP-type C4-dicarboxylate transport system permease small subunit|nr:TRAP transporter small permease [Accumulibacter sp.]
MLLTTINTRIMKLLNWVIVLSMVFLVTSISLQILNRFIMKIPMAWTEEYSKYFFVWLAMFGSAKAVREKSHIFVDIMEVLIKGRVSVLCGFAADCVSMVFFVTLFYVSIPWTVKNFGVDTESIPGVALGWFYLCIPLSAALMILFGLEVMIARGKGIFTNKGGE